MRLFKLNINHLFHCKVILRDTSVLRGIYVLPKCLSISYSPSNTLFNWNKLGMFLTTSIHNLDIVNIQEK